MKERDIDFFFNLFVFKKLVPLGFCGRKSTIVFIVQALVDVQVETGAYFAPFLQQKQFCLTVECLL